MANYVKLYPNDRKKQLKPFLDSQIIMANRFYERLAKTKNGKDKIKNLLDMRRQK